MTLGTPSQRRVYIDTGFLAWLALLGVLLAIGAIAFFQVFRRGLIITSLTDTVPWGLWITVDLTAIALGAGAFIFNAIVHIFRLRNFQPIVRLAVFVGIIGYTAALLTLVADIGRPDRFWHPLVFWNVHSVLWEITWCITLYLTFLMIEFAPVISELSVFERWPIIRRVGHQAHRLVLLVATAGLVVSLLHQSSLGAAFGVIKARPIWFKPSMPILFIVSAMAVGPAVVMAAAVLVEWVTGRRTVPHRVLGSVARFSGVGLLIYAYLKFWDLLAVSYYARTPGPNTALSILEQYTPYGFGFWVGEVIVGILIPVVFFLVPRFRRNSAYLVLGSLFAALGILFNRWNVTVSGLIVPLDFSPGTAFQLEASPYLPSLAEWGVVIGVVGYVLLAFTMGVRLLPMFNPSPGAVES